MLIALCSVKGSPGVTTATLGLAARWPVGDPVVVEADPAGGDLVARFRLPANPGLVSLAAAARRNPDPSLLATHCQMLPGGVRVVPGPVAAEQARAALGVLAPRGARAVHAAAHGQDAAVLLDLGRLDASSLALPIARGADAVLVLVRPHADELAHVVTLLETVPRWTRIPGLVLVGSGYAQSEVERELGVPVMGTLPDDPRGARVLSGQPSGSPPDRSGLGRAAARLAARLIAEIAAREYHVPPPRHDPAGPRPQPVVGLHAMPRSNGKVPL